MIKCCGEKLLRDENKEKKICSDGIQEAWFQNYSKTQTLLLTTWNVVYWPSHDEYKNFYIRL